MGSVCEYLFRALRGASVHNPEVQVAPACVLWPDKDRQWEAVIPVLQGELQELLVLGDYSPEERTGPAIWLRCAIAGKVGGASSSGNPDQDGPATSRIPILYLPGVSRQDLRAVESCSDKLKPLVELQYRGVIWSQVNAKDWTILAFLKSDQGGLGLDVARDNGTKTALQLALPRLLDEDVERLKGKRLDRDFFNRLLTGGDPVRNVLQWIGQADDYRRAHTEEEWQAFVEVCRSQLAFDPQKEGVLSGAALFAEHVGPWAPVWERYREAPSRYPGIPAQLRKCTPPSFDLLADAESAAGWPQWNDRQEADLMRELTAVADMPPHAARDRLVALEKRHASRRKLVWAELGEAPLAEALAPLATLSKVTSAPIAAGGPEDLAERYSDDGWKADQGVLKALSCAGSGEPMHVVSNAIRTVYLPWVEEAARHLQATWNSATADPAGAGETECKCLVFIDGLRFDCAKMLSQMLQDIGCKVEEKRCWTALPSVTGTGKPAVSPLRKGGGIAEEPDPSSFDVISPYQFEKRLEESGWRMVRRDEEVPSPGPPDKYPEQGGEVKLWVEAGNLDHEGHDRGWKMARQLDEILNDIRDRIRALLDAGWLSVHIVTDHGWLLVPGGLPKVNLESGLTETRWGRCALLKPGASTEERVYPWFWNPQQDFALADGVACFRKGTEYAHGGLSLQECLTLHLTVSRDKDVAASTGVEIDEIAWRGMRCTVSVAGGGNELQVDLRTQPGDPTCSVATGQKPKPVKKEGTASVVVEEEDRLGQKAVLVVLGPDGNLLAQADTLIGGEQ